MRVTSGTSLCWLGLSQALTTSNPSTGFRWDDVKYILAFGDSYTYVQGTAGRPNYSFVGDYLNYAYTPKTLLTSEIVENRTSAGGPNYVEYLTGCFSGLPCECPTQLWDFAFAGADVSARFLPRHHNFSVQLDEQIIQWSLYAKPVLLIDVSRALVVIFIGINDINDSAMFTFPRNNATDFPSFYAQIIHAEMNSVAEIYDAGYRNFLFMNLPPLDRKPGNQLSPTPLPNSTMVHQYNLAISSAAAQFTAAHPGAHAMVFDSYAFLAGIMDHPSRYGITNTTGFCPRFNAPDIATNYAAYGCQSIGDYFWYDSLHITWTVHRHLARAVERFLVGESR
ncbi:hypothetical protein LZ554_006859 [Drepanopeziza brunnea f. sp. 'monogermtubi']|nr:hypothetical protein LZ554_006859 [Drepanopeziza brunnea f. sp. 'monogermtubi']